MGLDLKNYQKRVLRELDAVYRPACQHAEPEYRV